MKNFFVATLCIFAFFISVGASVRGADPSPKTQFEPLRAIGYHAEEKALYEKLVDCDAKIRSTAEKLLKDRQPKGQEVGKLYVLVEQYRRWTDALRTYRSSAAVDFFYREKEYGKALTQCLTRFWGTPQAAQLKQKVRQTLARSEQRRLQQLQRIMQTLESGDAPAAEQMIDKLVDDVFLSAGILSPKEKEPISVPIQEVEGPVRMAMGKVRRQRATEALDAEVAKRQSNCQQLVTDINAAGDSGEVDVEGVSLAGPDAVAHFVQRWQMAQVEMLRSIALSRINAAGVVAGSFDKGMGKGSQPALSADEAHAFREAMLQAIGKFVAKDVASTSEAEAMQKFTRYNEVLSQMALLTDNQDWLPKMSATIAPLATKGNFAADLQAYREATSDVLRWRQRAAEAATKAQAAKTAADIAREKLTSKDKMIGLYTSDNQELPFIQKPIPMHVPDIQEALLKADIRLGASISLGGNTPMWMTRVDENFYGRLTGGVQDKVQHDALAADLMAGMDRPPLTLESSAALASSSAGHFDTVGGQVENFVIEGATPRFSTMPLAAADLVPYGSAPPDVEHIHPASVITLRLDVKPTWFQHRYYFSTGEN